MQQHVRIDDDRAAMLDTSRQEKMARSAHAFVRGNTVQHYQWLSDLPPLPEGPAVWICGDCHVGNLGPIADKDGRVAIQIRDLDQTTIGNPAHDIVRLALSLASAARGSDLPGVTATRIVENMIIGYQRGLRSLDDEASAPEPATGVDRQTKGTRPQMATSRERAPRRRATQNSHREKVLGTVGRGQMGDWCPARRTVRQGSDPLFGETIGRRQSRTRRRGLLKKGLRLARQAALCGARARFRRSERQALADRHQGGGRPGGDRQRGADIPTDHAERVVAGARPLSPTLWDRMASCRLRDLPVVIHELLPEDLKLEMEHFSRREAVTAALYLAGIVGKAHGRQMDETARREWSRDLGARHQSKVAVPSWLWSTVLALLVRHEGAYLEHCRLNAIKPA